MRKFMTLAKALVLVVGFAVAATGAQAQQAAPAADGLGFDGYRALAVTAGVIGGAAVAAVVTDGLIIPVYAFTTGAEMGGIGATLGMGGAGAGGGGLMTYGQQSYRFFRGSMRLLGAIAGGFYADSWYLGS
ncbi:MAG: hypothetical protein HQ481_03380 [Alphaproteobacteria bacterium]|nr:hypothetical protein [Alphaproteobacteria bacterium]